MATIIDQTDEVILEEGEELGNIEDLAVEETTTEETTEETTVEETAVEETTKSSIPDKFKGKSLEDIVGSYIELEKAYGRSSNEVGEVRKLADEILKNSLKANDSEVKKTEVDDLFENPDKVIENAINNSPKLKELSDELALSKQKDAMERFNAKYPHANELVQDADFQKWIESSSVRLNMFNNAHKNYDVDVAGELIELYEQLHVEDKELEDEAKKERSVNRDKALKEAITEKGGSGHSTKKIFKRADLLKMMRVNPDGYHDPAFQAALVKAYQENRVR